MRDTLLPQHQGDGIVLIGLTTQKLSCQGSEPLTLPYFITLGDFGQKRVARRDP